MAKAHSMDVRERVIAACEDGQTAAGVATRFRASGPFIEKLKRQRRERGALAPKPHAGGRRPLLVEHDEALRALLTAKPDTTLEEVRKALELKVQLSTLGYRLNHLGLTFKKTLHSAEQDREDVRVQRDAWYKDQPTLARHTVFVDETGATTVLARRYGWRLKGKWGVGTVPQDHWQTTTWVAALRQEGLTAPRVTEGPMAGDLFLADVREFLALTLTPADIVVWDNLSAHRADAFRKAIEAGAPFSSRCRPTVRTSAPSRRRFPN